MNVETIKTWWVEGELKQNTYIVEDNDYCILFDAGCPVAEIQKVTNKPIKAVFVTHGHYDHINCIEEYNKLNIPIYANKQITKLLNNAKLNVSELFTLPKKYKVKNICFVNDGDTVKIGDTTIECYYTPGHSPDGMTYKIGNSLFTGDTLFSVSVGRTDLPLSSSKQLIESLNKINKLNYINIYPGHGRISEKQEQTQNIATWVDILKQNQD